MLIQQAVISGNPKRIFTTSPSKIISLRKQYLRSLSPGKPALVHQSIIQVPKRLTNFRIKNLTFEVSDSRTSKRTHSIGTEKETVRLRTGYKPKSPKKKLVFKDRLRLNNL